MNRVRASLTPEGLAAYASRQLSASFPDGVEVGVDDLMPAVPVALARLEHCFSHVANKYFFDGHEAVFDHLHGDQYAMWLYLLANQLHRDGAPRQLCSKLFLLNKQLHGCDIYHEVELPSVFLLVHPLGTVLGRGTYGEFFISYQRCGIGSNHDVYPVLGRHVTLRPGSAVLGASRIGDGCSIATESLVLDREVPPDSVYIGNPRDFILRPQQGTQAIWRTP